MANIFSQNIEMGKRGLLENKYRTTRMNLLLVALVTVINVIFAATGGDSYFLFSATIPYLLTYMAAFFCGMFAPEYYEGEFAEMEFWPTEAFYIALAISAVIIALYLLAFFLSGKSRVGWLIFALVLFSLDTLVMIGYFGISLDMILDYVFHAWIIVILCIGIRAHCNLKKLPDEPANNAEAMEA